MKSNASRLFELTTLAAAMIAVYGPAHAQDAAVAELTKPESYLSLGIGNWSRDRRQQGIYDGMGTDGLYGLVDADVVRRNDATGTWMSFSTRNLGLDNREIRGEWLRQGDMGFTVEYNRTPRTNPLLITSPTRGVGSTSLLVSGAGANALTPSAEYHLGTRRELTSLGFYKNLGTGLDLKLSFKNEDRTGTRLWGRGSAAEFAVEPINHNMTQLEATLDYVTKRFQLQGGYYLSSFRNHNGVVDTIVNGAAPGTLANHTYLSLPLSNIAHQLYLNGGFQITQATRATFKLQHTKALQDETLPTQQIAGLGLAGAPDNLHGRLDMTLAQLAVTSRITSNFSGLASLRYYNNEEKTAQYRFVAPAGGVCGTCVDNTPLGFKTVTAKLEGTYRLPLAFSLIGGLELANQDRKVPFGNLNVSGVDNQRYVPFRAVLDETTYRLQLRRSMSESINGSIAYLHSERTGSDLTRTNLAQADQINPMFITDRNRDKIRATVDWSPTDRLGVTLNVESAKDKYKDDRPYGLKNGDMSLISLDVSYAVTDAWKVTAWYSHDKQKALQKNQRSGATVDALMEDRLSDTGDSIGLGVRGLAMPRLRVGTDLMWTRNVSQYKQSITLLGATPAYPAGNGGPLPDIHNNLLRLKLFGVYALDKNADLRFDMIFERWKTDDWTWTFSDGSPFTYGTTTDGTVISQAPKATSTFLGVRYIYRF